MTSSWSLPFTIYGSPPAAGSRRSFTATTSRPPRSLAFTVGSPAYLELFRNIVCTSEGNDLQGQLHRLGEIERGLGVLHHVGVVEGAPADVVVVGRPARHGETDLHLRLHRVEQEVELLFGQAHGGDRDRQHPGR